MEAETFRGFLPKHGGRMMGGVPRPGWWLWVLARRCDEGVSAADGKTPTVPRAATSWVKLGLFPLALTGPSWGTTSFCIAPQVLCLLPQDRQVFPELSKRGQVVLTS